MQAYSIISTRISISISTRKRVNWKRVNWKRVNKKKRKKKKKKQEKEWTVNWSNASTSASIRKRNLSFLVLVFVLALLCCRCELEQYKHISASIRKRNLSFLVLVLVFVFVLALLCCKCEPVQGKHKRKGSIFGQWTNKQMHPVWLSQMLTTRNRLIWHF